MYQNSYAVNRNYAVNRKNSARRRRPQPAPHSAAAARRGALRGRVAGDSGHGPEHHLHAPFPAQAGRPGGRPPHRQEQSLPPLPTHCGRAALVGADCSTRGAAQRSPKPPPTRPPCAACSRKRQDKMRSFFDRVAGRLGKDYVPGQSWKSVAEALLRLMPPMVIADLGAGEGAFALLLAQRAKKVIAVDTSAKMIEVGREQALRHGVENVEFRLGDMEEVPIARRRSRSGLLLPIAASRPAPRARRAKRPRGFSTPGGRIVHARPGQAPL